MKKIKYIFTAILLGSLVFLTNTTIASAHVVVKPNQVGVGQRLDFVVSVPTEKDNPTVGLKLIVPKELQSVTPNAKPGWNIDVKKTGEGESAMVSEIDWTGGSIPPGQRDEFVFSAQAPANSTTINWKAYQTYEDGTVVSWDQTPNTKMSDSQMEEMEKKNLGPYSQTNVINDLSVSPTPAQGKENDQGNNLSLVLSIVAIAMAGFALTRQRISSTK
ncbi:MAG TPA: YcnI family protein [Patescibacteria group bacterium]|nr:YcnI family protein [Patescibacteria group bacterium]